MITNPGVKINIGLNVIRKREDGYHDLETLFWPCSGYSDVLEIVRADDFSETAESLRAKYLSSNNVDCLSDRECSDYVCDEKTGSEQTLNKSADMLRRSNNEEKPLPVRQTIGDSSVRSEQYIGETVLPVRQTVTEDGRVMMTIARAEGVDWDPAKDLCVKAYYILLEDFPELPSVKIFLEKRSPVGAGLGGGSADAAFTLMMLNDMFSLGLSKDALASYAARLGSDCAFFIYGEPMFGTGRGDQLSSYDSSILDGYHIQLAVPENVSVRTAEAYRGVTPRIPDIPLADALRKPVESWKVCVHNDFEDSVFLSHLELASVKEELYASGAVYASMSGSGSAFFGIFKD